MAGIIDKSTSIDLIQLQHKLYAENKPTLLLIEGAGGSISAEIINEFIACLEPRGVEYHHFNPSNCPENILYYMKNTPMKGKFVIYDRSWYSKVIDNIDKINRVIIDSINIFEKYLIDNGVLLVKVYLNFNEKKLDKYLKTYPKPAMNKCGFLGDDESDYSKYSLDRKEIANLIDDTDLSNTRWDRIDVGDFEKTINELVKTVISRIKRKLDDPYVPAKREMKFIYKNPRDDVDLTRTISKEEYNKKLTKLQTELAKLQCKLVNSGRSLVLGFEGWDAAGKGGAIKRITQALNPRGFRAIPVPAPTKEELAHTHLWRFAINVPEPGHIAIFDRTWYGRMLVEPIESLIDEVTYSRAAEEINLFEYSLVDTGSIVIKFWIDISNEEQAKRFNERQENKLKQWKITDEDWRNREKWDVYEKYVDDMMLTTNTPYAPWYAISGQDKRYARIEILQIIVDTLKKELK